MGKDINNKLKEPRVFLLMGILTILIIEVFICNFRFWESLTFKSITNYQLAVGDGVCNVRDNVYLISEEGNACLYIYDINDYVENLYLNMDFEDNPKKDNTIIVSGTDEGNKYLAQTFEREYNPKVDQSNYYRIHFYGKVYFLQVDLSDFVGQEITLNEIKLNTKVPFGISGIRIGIMILGFGIFTLFLKTGPFLNRTYENLKHPKICYTLLVAGIIIVIGFWAYIAEHNAIYTTIRVDEDQYTDLTEALLQGKVSINKEATRELIEMDNPYDPFARIRDNIEFLWDYAYYEGQYYVYFGIVPVLLFYIPYFLIFGTHLIARKFVFFLLFLALWGTLTLLWKLMKKYFPKTPMVLFGFMSLLIAFSFGSCICHDPDIYSIPILASIAFSTFGLYLGILGFERTGKKRTGYFVLAALCLALTAGCRPQFVLVAVFLLPSFIGELKKKEVNVKEKAGMVLAVAIPYAIVAAGLMYYNYIRFGSVFDFGANYNLTTNDMRHRGFVFDRIWDGVFYQLLQPVALTNTFPFIESSITKFAYNGVVIQEIMRGGLFSICPFLYIGLYSLVKKDFYQNKKNKWYLGGSVVLGMVILIMDTEMAGIVYRYILDFGLFFFIPAIIAVMEIFNGEKREEAKVTWYRGILFVITISLVLYALVPFVEYDFLYNDFFMKVKTAVQFW